MTLREAVALAQQHEAARMSLTVVRSAEHGGGHFGTGTVRPHSMGDGGFMAAGRSWKHRPGSAIFIAWDNVISWHFSLDVKHVESS